MVLTDGRGLGIRSAPACGRSCDGVTQPSSDTDQRRLGTRTQDLAVPHCCGQPSGRWPGQGAVGLSCRASCGQSGSCSRWRLRAVHCNYRPWGVSRRPEAGTGVSLTCGCTGSRCGHSRKSDFRSDRVIRHGGMYSMSRPRDDPARGRRRALAREVLSARLQTGALLGHAYLAPVEVDLNKQQ